MNPEHAGLALRNWTRLTECSYFGRIIIAGVSNNGEYVYLATAISGRRSESQNRRYIIDGSAVRTDVVDSSMGVGDPSLTLYSTQDEECGRVFVISNGCQTGEALSSRLALGEALLNFKHEPDLPIYTNRITARCCLRRFPPNDKLIPTVEFAVHSPTEYGETLISSTIAEQIRPGYSMFLATYDGNGNPPLRFNGGPRILQTSEIDELNKLVDGLSANNEFLVAVSLKTIRILTRETSVQVWNLHGDKPSE